MKTLIRGVTSVPGAFLIGFAVSLFLLPCTSGPYIVILGLLAHATEWGYAMALLVLYNFIFVLPMLIITGAIYFGFTTTEKAEEWYKVYMDMAETEFLLDTINPDPAHLLTRGEMAELIFLMAAVG